jgi:PAS domain S-box-containing protein
MYMTQFRKYGLGLILVWTCILAAFLLFIIDDYHKDTINEATREARGYHGLNLHYRRWGANIGGVYALTDKVTPNPYLNVPDRDVKTESGKSLTLVNPAFMTRMVFETIQKGSKNSIINRLVSLNPLNPANTPNPWEQETLKLFEKLDVRERTQVLTIDEQQYLQFMAAFITEESCLKCHAQQGYKVGDVRGGISIAIPIREYLTKEAEKKNQLFGGFAFLWILGTTGIAVSSKRRHAQDVLLREHANRLEEEVFERQQTQEQLEEQSQRLEEEITERQLTQEQLEEQAAMLEEESAERQQAVAALQKTEHFLHAIIESEPECVKLLDADCNLLLMNRAGLEMIEADSFEQVQGQCVCAIVCEPYRCAFAELTHKVFQGASGNLEFEVLGLKGSKAWLHTTAVPFRDENGIIVAALGITRNVTELKHSEAALLASEDRFRGIAESLADWIWEIDATACFSFSSESSERVLGYTHEEIIGKCVYDFIDPEDVDRVREAFKEHTSGKTPIKNLEHWNITKDGRRVCLLTNGVPMLDPQGELVGYRGVDSDVTEQRMLERQASQQQKLESIGLLAGGIAHDFNNMLVPIMGYAEMINTLHSSDEKTTGYSSTILKAAEKAKELVSRLLTFSRLQPLKVEKHDLNEIIDSFMVILKRTIRENIEIRMNLSPEPCMIMADKSQIEQALLNLAVNAQDAISGTGNITIETGHLIFDHEYSLRHPGTSPGRYVMIAFSDTGSGIDEATLPHIFDPFFTTKPVGRGTGLGLSSIFGVVKQHEGSIDVDSRPGVGTTFRLFFPESTSDNYIPEKAVVIRSSIHQVGTILVVEDNPMVLKLVRDILEGVGHRIITADDPSQALEIIRSCSEEIDLLISDIVMPQMNGPELYERICDQMPGLKVLFMSGYAGVVSAHNGHLEEETNFISKPFTIEAFLRKVYEVMAGTSTKT